MANTERARQRGNDVGVVGLRVGEQVRRVRAARAWTQEDLARALDVLGRPIPVASIGRLESGDRRVDVDDLLLIAYALEVSPLALLLPFTQTPGEPIDLIGTPARFPAFDAWLWALGVDPLHLASAGIEGAQHELGQFRTVSRPWWLTVDGSINERAMEIERRWPAPQREGVDPMYDELSKEP